VENGDGWRFRSDRDRYAWSAEVEFHVAGAVSTVALGTGSIVGYALHEGVVSTVTCSR
jgi:hypothetical protein